MADKQPVIAAPEPASQEETKPAEQPAESAPAEPKAKEQKEEAEPQGKEYQKLRKRAQQAEQESAYLRGLVEGGKKPEAQVRQPDGPPKLETYENYDDYLVAKAKYEVRQEQSVENKNREIQRIQDSYNEKFLKVAEKHPDLPQLVQELIRNPQIPKHPAVEQAIMESDVGPEITLHLAQNPAEAARIGRMAYQNPLAAAREIGKIEARIMTPEKPTQIISQAPEPIKAVASKGSVTVFDYEKADINDFMRKRQEEAPPGRRR